jgi:hypothetical protein
MGSEFGWPEWYVVALYLIGFTSSSARVVRDQNIGSGLATCMIFLCAASYLFGAYALHRGGFW